MEHLRQEWRRNARLRFGVLIAVLILGAQAALALSDARRDLAQQHARDAELFSRLQATAAERSWPARARQAEARRLELLAAIPEARNEGAARADLQARLDQLAKDAVLAEALIRVETVLDVPDYPQLRQAVGRLEGTIASPLDAAPISRALAAGLPWMQAEQFEIGEGQPVRVVAIVRAFYRKPGLLPPGYTPAVPASAKQPAASQAPAKTSGGMP